MEGLVRGWERGGDEGNINKEAFEMHHAKSSGFHVVSALFPEQSKTVLFQCQTCREREKRAGGGEREGSEGEKRKKEGRGDAERGEGEREGERGRGKRGGRREKQPEGKRREEAAPSHTPPPSHSGTSRVTN